MNTSTADLSAISLMSAPAAKAFSEPVIRMQPMPSSASKRRDRLRQFGIERGVERVERLRPVEPDDADATLGFDGDGFVAHGLTYSISNDANVPPSCPHDAPVGLP